MEVISQNVENREEHLKFVKSHIQSADEYMSNPNALDYRLLTYDTESSEIREYPVGHVLKYQDEVRVHQNGFGSINSNYQVHLRGLDELFKVIPTMFKEAKKQLGVPKAKKNRKTGEYQKYLVVNVPIGVHNLAWDYEFFLHYLNKIGYKHQNLKPERQKFAVERTQQINVKNEPKSFHVMKNGSTVYGVQVFTEVLGNYHVRKDNIDIPIIMCLDFWDTLKVCQAPVSKFNEYTDNVDPMFYKLGDNEAEYDKVRGEDYIHTEDEHRYFYNDLYILGKMLEQFYINELLKGDYDKIKYYRTTSGISLANAREYIFGGKKGFKEYYGTNMPSHFGVIEKTLNTNAYKGGMVLVFTDRLGHVINKGGGAWDINSSYPDKMAHKPLPYGQPILLTNGDYPNFEVARKELTGECVQDIYFEVELGFDCVRPKNDKFKIPFFKIGSENITEFKKRDGNKINGRNYFYDSMFDGEPLHLSRKGKTGTRMDSTYCDTFTSIDYKMMCEWFEFGERVKDKDGFYTGEIIWSNVPPSIGRVVYYRAESEVYKYFINELVEIKVQANHEKKLARKNSAKVQMNGLYGKYGTKTDMFEEHMEMKGEEIVFVKAEPYTKEGIYKPVASAVTAYGREHLLRTAVAVGVENVMYGDTDSIFVTLPYAIAKERIIAYGGLVDPDLLGAWDYEEEKEFDSIKILGAKKYMLKKGGAYSIKCAGLPKTQQKQVAKGGFTAFEYNTTVSKKQRRKCKGGVRLVETEFTIGKLVMK